MKKKNDSPGVNTRLFDPYLERMNFLNEISIDYPRAISFGSGRPDQKFFHVQEMVSDLHSFALRQCGGEEGLAEYYDSLGQYNKTKGIINEDISRLLSNDEDIRADPEDIIVTNGAQEGMAIVINSLFDSSDGVILVSDPSYIGFVGYARIAGVPVVPVRRDEDSICLGHLEETVLALKKEHRQVRAVYEVVDFHNPTGSYTRLDKRKRLIELAERYDFLIVEDNPYGYFRYDVDKIPTLKALDRHRRVIYLGSFSKTLFPSMRLGYLVADQVIEYGGRSLKLVEELKKTKSFTTVNTSSLVQAMAGSFFYRHDYSLKESCRPKVEACRKKRDALMEALESCFPRSESWTEGIVWNRPGGGFFLSLDIPFAMSDELLLECVKEQGVIFCPMYYFCLDRERGTRQIRLAFSNLSPERIGQGVERLSAFIKEKVLE